MTNTFTTCDCVQCDPSAVGINFALFAPGTLVQRWWFEGCSSDPCPKVLMPCGGGVYKTYGTITTTQTPVAVLTLFQIILSGGPSAWTLTLVDICAGTSTVYSLNSGNPYPGNTVLAGGLFDGSTATFGPPCSGWPVLCPCWTPKCTLYATFGGGLAALGSVPLTHLSTASSAVARWQCGTLASPCGSSPYVCGGHTYNILLSEFLQVDPTYDLCVPAYFEFAMGFGDIICAATATVDATSVQCSPFQVTFPTLNFTSGCGLCTGLTGTVTVTQ